MQRGGALSLASAIGLTVGWLAASACSALVDQADAQCVVDADCAKFGAFACVQGGCAPRAAGSEAGGDAAAVVPCSSTAECRTAHAGGGWVCRHEDSTCVSLLSPDCQTVLGEYASDDTILLGALLPIDGPHASTGAALADALRLAVIDFAAGIPRSDGGARRPLAVVLCNESTDVDRAATHLTDELLVSGIVGTGDGTTTRGVARDVTVQRGALLISPRATADLSSVSTSGLVWRTCPSDAIEGAAIVALAEQMVLPDVIATNGLTTVNVALVHATDVESTELDAKITSALHINGALATDPSNTGQFVHVDYGDPDTVAQPYASSQFTSAVDAVVMATTPPDVVLIVGSTQAAPNVLGAIERGWTAPRRPRYIVSSGLQTSELLALVSGADPFQLRTRILGTAPGGSGANVDAFYARYAATAFGDGTAAQEFGVAQAYDALYALAFAEAVTAKAAPFGSDLRDALRVALTPRGGTAAAAIDVGPAMIDAGFGALAAGEAIAMNGASGPLPFQTGNGDVVTDVQVWCIGAGDGGFERSGVAYLAGDGGLGGEGGCQ